MTARGPGARIEKLGREADRAVWSHQVAEEIRELVVVALENGSDLETVRRALDVLVGDYARKQTAAVHRFVSLVGEIAEPRRAER